MSSWFTIGLFAPLLSLSAPAVQEVSWNQWRGPGRDGHVPDALLFAEWPAEYAEVWRVDVGEGHSSPVTDGERVYVLTREGESEVVRALGLADGAEVWSARREATVGVNQYATAHGRFPRATPLVAEGRLYTLGVSAVLQCFDTASGELRWDHADFGAVDTSTLFCGTSASPILAGGLLVVYTGDDRGGALRAFDPVSGESRWAKELEGPGYASSVLDTRGPSPLLVFLSESRVLGVAARDGALVWMHDFPDKWQENIVTPLLCGERDVLVSGTRRGTFRLGLPEANSTVADSAGSAAAADAPAASVRWSHKDLELYMSSPVLHAGKVYALDPRRRGSLVRLDPDSGAVEELGVQELGENASLLAHRDRLVLLTTSARFLVLDLRAELPETILDTTLPVHAPWAHPLPIAGGMVVKGAKELVRFGGK